VRPRYLLPAVAVLVVAVGLALFGPMAVSSERGRFVRGAADDTTTPFNLVSLPALARHHFRGHDLVLERLVARDRLGTRWEISYRGDGLRLSGTLAVPVGGGSHPLVVTMHGYVPPPAYRSGAGLHREESRLLADGYAVLHPDYRNFGDSQRETGRPVADPLGYPADVLNAVVALKKARLPGIDLTRIALLGRSMGGGVALQVAEARPHWFDALVLSSPVSSDATNDYLRWVAPDRGLERRVTAAYGSPQSDPDFYARASSIDYLARIRGIPVQIHHGLADLMCPEVWSQQTAAAMREAGVKVALASYAGQPHRFTDAAWPLYMGRVDRFLATTLR
jgi:dipeptidyl aminopeptidase/acylaminoacyl peptidase